MNKANFEKANELKLKKEAKKFHQQLNHFKHPIQSTKANADEYAQLGRENWKQTAQPPHMTREEAFKKAGNAFSKLGVSNQVVIFIFIIGFLVFCFIGMMGW